MVVNKLDALFSALSDPTRRQMIGMLAHGALPMNELLKPFDLTQQAVSKHVRVLEKAGLVKKQKVGRERICSADLKALADVADWAETYQRRWEDSLERLEDFLVHNNKRKKRP